MSSLAQAAMFLGSAVVAVPVFRWLGLGAILGYLSAGIVIGPWGLGLVRDVDSILHLGELGVVLLLFVIGLELQPRRLWALRRSVFGLGGLQVGATALLIGVAAWYVLSVPPSVAVVVGAGLSLSSTAFALQTLAERRELTTRHGRSAFGILLFQDLIVIPVLALLPLLGAGEALSPQAAFITASKALAVVAAIILGGHYLLRQLLRLVAKAGSPEVFTATALLIVIGTALMVDTIGLSMALGAFLAGVLLADSEYRHELEAGIEPFRGLLLGLFFIAVGMSVNVGLMLDKPGTVLGLTAGLLFVKFALLYGLGRRFGLPRESASSLGVALSQGGEFAFVIFGAAVGAELMERALSELLILTVILSMAITPFLFIVRDRALSGRATHKKAYDQIGHEENPVLIAGFGRFGQIIARILRAKRIGFTALEVNPDQVDFVRQYGNKIYYGDASRIELLRAANAQEARLFVLAIDDPGASLRTAETVRRHFPNLKIYARARNRKHAYQLMDLGISIIRRETFLSSVDLAREILQGLGLSKRESQRIVNTFKAHDERRLMEHHALHKDEEKMIYLAKRAAEELEELFVEDAQQEDEDGRTAGRR